VAFSGQFVPINRNMSRSAELFVNIGNEAATLSENNGTVYAINLKQQFLTGDWLNAQRIGVG
jgi:hypothetical protein